MPRHAREHDIVERARQVHPADLGGEEGMDGGDRQRVDRGGHGVLLAIDFSKMRRPITP